MIDKYIWNENDIKFIGENIKSIDVNYSDVTASSCPYNECELNTVCNSKCSNQREEEVYELICQIYDNIADEINAKSSVSEQLSILKNKMQKYIKSSYDEGMIMCIKIQLFNEFKNQTGNKIDNSDKFAFFEN